MFGTFWRDRSSVRQCNMLQEWFEMDLLCKGASYKLLRATLQTHCTCFKYVRRQTVCFERLSCFRIQTFPNIHDFHHMSSTSAYLSVCLRGTTPHPSITYHYMEAQCWQPPVSNNFFSSSDLTQCRICRCIFWRGFGDEGGDGGGAWWGGRLRSQMKTCHSGPIKT